MKTLFSSVVFVLLATCCWGQAIAPVAPAKGAFSVGFSAEWFKSEHAPSESIFMATPAYFVTDRLELRLPFALDRTNTANETIYGFGARWHFAQRNSAGVNSRLDPFLGAVVEHASATGGFREDFIGGQGGAHYFVANNVAVTGLITEGRDRMNGLSQSTFHFVVGFSIFWK